MMNGKVCKAIKDNIQRDFTESEMIEFRKRLCEVFSGDSDSAQDLCDCIMLSAGKDVHLDTVVRDKFYDAYLLMHLG